jgi:predicted TIM-barrel fold metal-dependent hydrolase
MNSGSTCACSSSAMSGKSLSGKEKFGGVARAIDVHHHLEPTFKNVEGTPWSVSMSLDEMDRNGIATAIGYAGPLFPDNVREGRKRARETNEWSTELRRNHPGRFGLFASLPMTDIEGSLTEIEYAFDVLHADGVGISTHYEGAGLGDVRFRPVFEELNRRRAVVYVHPAKAPCETASSLTYESDLISAPWIEFPANTARTILSLWAAGTTRRLPDIKFLFCHGGGLTPLLLGRFAGFACWNTVGPEKLATIFPDGVYAEFAKFYIECAQGYAPETIAMLQQIVPPAQLLFGSDYSYFPISHSVGQFESLSLTDAQRRQIAGENAAALFPAWAAT